MSMRFALLATALLFAVLPLFGQGVEGSINGTVADQTGSVILDASFEALVLIGQEQGKDKTNAEIAPR